MLEGCLRIHHIYLEKIKISENETFTNQFDYFYNDQQVRNGENARFVLSRLMNGREGGDSFTKCLVRP